MRTPVTAAVMLCLVLSTCGPVPSLHPLYTQSDLVFEPALLGTWTSNNGQERNTLTFERQGDRGYKTVFTEKSTSTGLAIHLVRLGAYSFFDVYPARRMDGGLAVSTHFFCKVLIERDSLRLAYLDETWLQNKLKDGSVKLAHEFVDSDLVLTASTKDLQQFVMRHAEDEEAFPDPGVFHKQ